MQSYSMQWTIRPIHCDPAGFVRIGAIQDFLQETAGEHCLLLGCDIPTLQQKGLSWVITRFELRMQAYPHAGETVTVRTTAHKPRLCFFPRSFSVERADGTVLGTAYSLWLPIDVETRSMAAPGTISDVLPGDADAKEPFHLSVRSAYPTETAVLCDTVSFTPRYIDLDANGHMNNARYTDLACNILGIDTMERNSIQNISVLYDREILPGQTVLVKHVKDGDTHYLSATAQDRPEGKPAFEITVKTVPVTGV